MIYKLVCAALLVGSGTEALKVGATGVSRRAALAKAASIALPLAASPAFALNRAEDAEIYKRADEGKLNAIRAIERAKDGNLADGTSATVSPPQIASCDTQPALPRQRLPPTHPRERIIQYMIAAFTLRSWRLTLTSLSLSRARARSLSRALSLCSHMYIFNIMSPSLSLSPCLMPLSSLL